ncbi:uncharacterized protein LOC135108421 isoform X2 [Scylla paramamosain]|uniref:uncharacterized protein LOC135108421 isoform X2 n=1 Tax=Scylla paramamosain TaxID=85552 RepID=UPI0030827D0F
MAVRTTCVLLLLGWLRAVGGFPYSWRWGAWGQLEARRSVVGAVWSWLIVVTLSTLALACVFNTPVFKDDVADTSARILNYVNYSTSILFLVYLVLRQSRLALILRRLEDAGVPLRRRLVHWDDAVQLTCTTGMLVGLSVATFSSVSDFFVRPLTRQMVMYHIPATTCDIAIEVTALVLSLLLYFILKVVSLEGDAAVNAATASTLTWKGLAGPRLQLRNGRERMWKGCSGRGRLPPEEVLRLVSRRLLELDDIVEQLVEYGGPPAGMILLCSALNATVMLYLTISKFDYYYLAFITLKVLSIVQVTFIPDWLWCKREENLRLVRRQLSTTLYCASVEAAMKDVEKVVAEGTTFRVCRLFTLDRHIILSILAVS